MCRCRVIVDVECLLEPEPKQSAIYRLKAVRNRVDITVAVQMKMENRISIRTALQSGRIIMYLPEYRIGFTVELR